MNDKKNKKEELMEEVVESQTAVSEGAEAETTDAMNLNEDYEKLDLKVKELSSKCDEYLNMAQRTAAEFDNFKKRTVKEKEVLYSDAYADAIEAFLPVVDNMERAMSAINEEGNGVSTLKEGVDMVYKQLKDVFTKLGVEEIEAEGKTFDPLLHNAVMHIEDEAAGENQIIEVFQKGYKLKNKILRHSMVKVAN